MEEIIKKIRNYFNIVASGNIEIIKKDIIFKQNNIKKLFCYKNGNIEEFPEINDILQNGLFCDYIIEYNEEKKGIYTIPKVKLYINIDKFLKEIEIYRKYYKDGKPSFVSHIEAIRYFIEQTEEGVSEWYEASCFNAIKDILREEIPISRLFIDLLITELDKN